VEWSPHVSTQANNKDVWETDEQWHFSTHASIGSSCGSSDASTISFHSLALEHSLTASAPRSSAPHEAPLSPMTSDEDEDATRCYCLETGQQRGSLEDIPSCCFTDSDATMLDSPLRQVTLEPRKPTPLDVRSISASSQNEHVSSVVGAWDTQLVSPMSSFASTSSVSTATSGTRTSRTDSTNTDQGMTTSRLKRRRGGSDCSMATASDNDDCAATGFVSSSAAAASSPPRDRRKRMRLHRNRALVAQEFDSILSQICSIGPY
jgi:hypothetical protein